MTEPERARAPKSAGWLWIWIVLFVVAVLVVILWAWPASQPPAETPGEGAPPPVGAILS